MRLPRFDREVIERWVSGVERNTSGLPRSDYNEIHKRQGLLAGLLNGVGDILGTNPKTTTTVQAKPTQATQVVSSPAPAPTSQTPPPPVLPTQPPVVSKPPQTFAPPVQIITAPAPSPIPTSQIPQPVPVLSSVTQRSSSIPIAIPLIITAVPTIPLGNGALPTTTAISFISLTSIVSLVSTSIIVSTITSNGVVYPTTFATSTIFSPSTTRLTESLTTMNVIMGSSNNGRISTMTVIISIVSVLVGSLFILLISYFVSKNYIKKRKITIALDMRISQLQQGDGPLPPVPMRMKMKNEAMEFMLRFPRPPSLRGMGMGRTSREKQRGGFEILRS